MPVNTQSSPKGNPLMKKNKDILHLLEEVQTVAQTLCGEKADLGDQVKNIEAKMSTLRGENTQEIGNLREINGRLTTELQETKTELTKIEAEVSTLRGENTQEIGNLQEINAHLTQELQETKTQLAQALQAPPKVEPTKIEAQLSKLRAEKTQEIWNLQEINAHLTQELQETKTRLAKGLPAPPPQTELTQEVQTLQASNAHLTQELQETKTQLAQVLQASPTKTEPTKEVQKLQASNAHLTQELHEALAQLAHRVPSGEESIDSLSPEVQNLKEQLKHAELHNQLLEQEVSKQHDEIQELERSLETNTSETIASSSPTPRT